MKTAQRPAPCEYTGSPSRASTSMPCPAPARERGPDLPDEAGEAPAPRRRSRSTARCRRRRDPPPPLPRAARRIDHASSPPTRARPVAPALARPFAHVEHQVAVVVHVIAARDPVQVRSRPGPAGPAAADRTRPSTPAPIGTPLRARAGRHARAGARRIRPRAWPSRRARAASRASRPRARRTTARFPLRPRPPPARDNGRRPRAGAGSPSRAGGTSSKSPRTFSRCACARRRQAPRRCRAPARVPRSRAAAHPPPPARAGPAQARAPPPGGRVPCCSTVLVPAHAVCDGACDGNRLAGAARLTPDGRMGAALPGPLA